MTDSGPRVMPVCEVVVKPDVFEWLTAAEQEQPSTVAQVLDYLGNRDLDEMIDLYRTISKAAEVKARAYESMRGGLLMLEELEARDGR